MTDGPRTLLFSTYLRLFPDHRGNLANNTRSGGINFFFPGATQPTVVVYFTALYRALASSRTRLLDHTERRATVGRTPLNEWSVRRRDLYLKTHNTQNRQTSMPPGGIRNHDRSRRAAEDLRLRPRGYWDRQILQSVTANTSILFFCFSFRLMLMLL